MRSVPSEADIEELHRLHASSPDEFKLVWTHCKIVRDIALKLAKSSRLDVNYGLLEAGALLHDIGVYRVGSHGGGNYIRHGVLGEALLVELGQSPTLSRFASCHTGVGITKEQIEANDLPLPRRDYLAETLEEQVVMYADKFHSKSDPPCFVSFEAYAQEVSQFGASSLDRFLRFGRELGRPDLSSLVASYGHALCGPS